MNLYNEVWENYLKCQKSNETIVNAICSNFLIKQSANQIQKVSFQDTGKIDRKRLKYYRTSDNIFARGQTNPTGKNHGIFILVDLSASMREDFPHVIQQCLNLVNFCSKVNIPFQIYGFTSKIAEENFVVLHQLLISDMSVKDLNNAKLKLWAIANMAMDSTYVLNMGATPTINALISISKIVLTFKQSNSIDIVNFILISDGIFCSPEEKDYEFFFDNKITKTRKIVKVLNEPNQLAGYDLYKFVVGEIKNTININMIWFNIGKFDEVLNIANLYNKSENLPYITANQFKNGLYTKDNFCNFNKVFYVDVNEYFDTTDKTKYNRTLMSAKSKKVFGMEIANAISERL